MPKQSPIGLLWFRDDPKRSLDKDIEWCAVKFLKKFKVKADTIQVPESEFGLYEKVTGYDIIPVKNISKGYFWMMYQGKKLEVKNGRSID